jgi:hypothetical protein
MGRIRSIALQSPIGPPVRVLIILMLKDIASGVTVEHCR